MTTVAGIFISAPRDGRSHCSSLTPAAEAIATMGVKYALVRTFPAVEWMECLLLAQMISEGNAQVIQFIVCLKANLCDLHHIL
jgi:hypothetical protein